MKKNSWLLLVLFFLLLAAAYFFFTRGSGSFRNADKQFSVTDTSLIRKVEITCGDDSVTLQRQDGQWTVDNMYPAREQLIRGLLSALHRLQPDVPVSRKKHDEILRQLRGHAKKVTITMVGRPAKIYYAWHDSLNGGATYMVLEGSDQPFRMHVPGWTVTDIYSLYRTRGSFWRDNVLFSLQPAMISSVEVRHNDHPEASFRIEKQGEGWILSRLSGNKPIDSCSRDNLMNYLYYFINVRFDEILAEGDVPSREQTAGQPAAVISVKLTDGTATMVRFYPRYFTGDDGERVMDMNRLYLRMNDSQEVILARYIQVDLILKDLSYFLPQG
jgi:hypothetical protein